MNDQISIHDEPDKKSDNVFQIDRIKVESKDGRLITTSLNVAHVFGKRHDHVVRDIEKLDCSPEFREPNFGVSYYTNDLSSAGERKYKKYEMTRDGFTFLVMGYTGKTAARFKEGYIAKFNEMEKELIKASQFHIPQTMSEALQLAADQAKQLEEAQPKIEFYDKIGDAQGLHTVAEVAKMFGTGRNRLFEWLRVNGYLRHNNEPFQTYIDRGYFEVRESPYKNIVNVQTFITPKGLQHLQKAYFQGDKCN